MSYFGLHPYHPHHQQQRRPAAHAQPYPFASGHAGYPFATPAPATAPQYNFYASSPTPPDLSYDHYHGNAGRSLEEEERAAIAHLRSIQRRKEAERVVREEAERERLVAQLQAHREQQLAAAAARAERERERRAALAAEYERRAAIARRVQQIEAAQAQQAEAHRRQQAIAAIAHAERQRERAIAAKNAISERRGQCARQCAARRQARSDDREAGLDEFSRFLASIFGVAVDDKVTADDEKPENPSTTPASAPVEAKKEEPVAATSVADPAEPVLPAAAEPVAATQPEKSEQASDKKPEFPEAINDLLANFLGLRVEPESKLGQAVSDKVPQGLNELLGQFGLEFVPDATADPAAPTSTQPEAGPSEQKKSESQSNTDAASAESSQPRHPFDLSEFLSGPNSLPPFVRDILGNVEQAFKNEQQAQQEEVKKDAGKGKGVAEGEKKTQAPASSPAPAPAPEAEPVIDEKTVSSDSLAKLASIASEVKLATDTFTFPSALSFSHNSPTEAVPSLLFNKQNKPYHAQNNKLLQLLLQADGVASNGDREVRRKRKEVVKQVEGELERLEQKRDEYWRQVRDRREQGEVSSDDESSSWTTGSAVDHTEDHPVHVEDVAAPAAEPETAESEQDKADDAAAAAETDAHPTTFAEAVKSDTKPEEAHTATQESSVEATSVPAEEKVKKSENEEGYELI